MKKVVLMALFAGIFAISANAQEQKTKTEAAPAVTGTVTPGWHYVDTNKDGVCDNWTAHHTGSATQGKNYVDANKDGVCDNHSKNHKNGNGYGYRRGNGNGHGHRHGLKD
ncbi:MAG: hypothetical protein V2A54_17035 [Bacteroidota bacterium]